jgi:hypothetical protein
MLKSNEHIRKYNLDAIIVIAVLFFGLFIFCNSAKNSGGQETKPVTTYKSVSEDNAISGQCMRLQIFQKTWILNRNNFNLLAFNTNPLSENRKTSLKVTQLQILRQSSCKIPYYILRYHLFPVETDIPPFLS